MGIMTASNLDRLIEEVKTLTPDEQRSLRDLVDELLVKSAPTMTEEEFEQHLLKKGVISRIPPRIRGSGLSATGAMKAIADFRHDFAK
jgi:hypothetical protein